MQGGVVVYFNFSFLIKTVEMTGWQATFDKIVSGLCFYGRIIERRVLDGYFY